MKKNTKTNPTVLTERQIKVGSFIWYDSLESDDTNGPYVIAKVDVEAEHIHAKTLGYGNSSYMFPFEYARKGYLKKASNREIKKYFAERRAKIRKDIKELQTSLSEVENQHRKLLYYRRPRATTS